MNTPKLEHLGGIDGRHTACTPCTRRGLWAGMEPRQAQRAGLRRAGQPNRRRPRAGALDHIYKGLSAQGENGPEPAGRLSYAGWVLFTQCARRPLAWHPHTAAWKPVSGLSVGPATRTHLRRGRTTRPACWGSGPAQSPASKPRYAACAPQSGSAQCVTPGLPRAVRTQSFGCAVAVVRYRPRECGVRPLGGLVPCVEGTASAALGPADAVPSVPKGARQPASQRRRAFGSKPKG